MKNKLVLFVFCFLSLSKINAAIAQRINFSIIPNPNLSVSYQTESDFEVEKRISNAFRLNFGPTNLRLAVSARVISTLSISYDLVKGDLYTVAFRNTNGSIGKKYQRDFSLDLFDQEILVHQGSRQGGNIFYDYDLIIAPLDFDIEPGQYLYSILFTVTPD